MEGLGKDLGPGRVTDRRALVAAGTTPGARAAVGRQTGVCGTAKSQQGPTPMTAGVVEARPAEATMDGAGGVSSVQRDRLVQAHTSKLTAEGVVVVGGVRLRM